MNNLKINQWLSAALDDPNACQEFKDDITNWFDLLNNYELVSKDRYYKMKKELFKLECLEAGGVDNWEWYSEALEPYWDEEDED